MQIDFKLPHYLHKTIHIIKSCLLILSSVIFLYFFYIFFMFIIIVMIIFFKYDNGTVGPSTYSDRAFPSAHGKGLTLPSPLT